MITYSIQDCWTRNGVELDESERPRGKRYRVWRRQSGTKAVGVYCATIELAEAKLDELRAIDNASATPRAAPVVVSNDVTLGEYFETVYWPYRRSHVKPDTANEYWSMYENHVRQVLGKVKIRDIDELVLQSWIDGMTGKPGTIALRVKAVVAPLLRFANKKGIGNGVDYFDPAEGYVELPDDDLFDRAPDEVLSDEEVALVIANMLPRYRAMARLGAKTGMRAGELRGLRWSQISQHSGYAWVTVSHQLDKTGDGRRRDVAAPTWKRPKGRKRGSRRAPVQMPLSILDELEEHRERFPAPHGLIFSNARGNPLSQATPATEWRDVLRKIDKSAERDGQRWRGWHQLRHHYAGKLLSAGVEPSFVAAQLGHASLRTTYRYYEHLIPTKHVSDYAMTIVADAPRSLRVVS